jgi:hypothetical protein
MAFFKSGFSSDLETLFGEARREEGSPAVALAKAGAYSRESVTDDQRSLSPNWPNDDGERTLKKRPKTSHLSPAAGLLALVMAFLLPSGFSLKARATSVQSPALVDYRGILVLNNGAIDPMPATAHYIINNFHFVASSATYRVGIKMLDAAGLTVATEVLGASFQVNLPPHGETEGVAQISVSPGALTDGAPYHLSAQLYIDDPNNGWTPAGGPVVSLDYRFHIVDAATDAGVVPWLNTEYLSRAYVLASSADAAAFQVEAQGVIGRLEHRDQAAITDTYHVYFDLSLSGMSSGPVQLTTKQTSVDVSLASYAADGGAASMAIDQFLDFAPALPVDSTDTYTFTIALSYAGPDGVVTPGPTVTLAGQQLLYFNGVLQFGPVNAVVTDFADDPAPGLVVADGVMATVDLIDGGSLQSAPGFSLQSRGGVPVKVLTDGTAQVQDGLSVALNPPATPDIGLINGVSFVRENLALDSSGGHAYCTVTLPTGFGVAAAPNLRRLVANYPAGTLSLDSFLNPVGPVVLPPGNIDAINLYAVHEQLPEKFKCGGITWDVGAATFTLQPTDTLYVRQPEMDALDALPQTAYTLAAKIRPSNDGLYRYPGSGAGSPVVVQADAHGRAILASARIDLPTSSYTTHFPFFSTVSWTQPGAIVITDGLVDSTQSMLNGADNVVVNVSVSGNSNTTPASIDSYTFAPSQGVWTFTPDGGLRAEGSVAPATLRWGTSDGVQFAQTISGFTTADALIPGVVLRGSLATTVDDQRPGELLYTGFGQPGQPDYVERPGTLLYYSGFADYAGLNFRVTPDGGETAISAIGDSMIGPYPLRPISKYYARPSGVSGIHAADTATFKALANGLVVFGFALQLNDYQLDYLDNTPSDSLVSGVVQVPGVQAPDGTKTPGFGQPFIKLMFDGLGRPTVPILPEPNPVQHLLSYWNVNFHPLSAEFQTKPGSPGTHALILGGETLIPGVIPDPIRGALGFFPDGHLVAAADGFPGVNSRLKPPKLITLHGTLSGVNPSAPGFSVHPISDLYFNDPYADGAPTRGFAAFAGTIKVPFFRDLQVHVLARANGAGSAVRSGWTNTMGDTFFTQAGFDSANRGYPPGVAESDYENGAESPGFAYYDPGDPAHNNRNPYNPLAQQSWLGFVDLALPIVWDPAQRRFLSSVPEQRNFLVLNSQRVIQQLTPSGADIRFGIQFNGLPRLNLAALVIDDKEATDQLLKFVPQGPQLVAGLNAFEKLLNNQSDELISQGLDSVIDLFLDDLFAAGGPLDGVQSATGAVAAFGTAGSPAFVQLEQDLQKKLSGVVGTITDANSVMRDIHDALADIDSGLGVADSLLAKDADGNRGAFITQTINMAASIGLPADDVSQVTDQATALINGELAPTLDEIQSAIDDVRTLSKSAKDLVGSVESITQAALDAVNVAGSLPDTILGAITEDFSAAHDPTGLLLVETDRTVLRAHLKKIIHDTVSQSGFVTDLQSSVRDLVEPLHNEYGAAFDQIFGVMNNVVRSALESLSDQVIDELNGPAGQVNRAIGGFKDTFGMTKIEGSASIIGDVLDRANINGTLALHVPDAITLQGSVDFQRFRADQPVPGCAVGNPDGRMQITVTAKGDAALSGAPPAHARAQGQYTMRSDGSPLGLAGSLSVDTDAHFDIVSLKHAEFDFAFGAMDNYIYGEGAGSILLFDVNVRAFLGRTCDAALLNRIDPQITKVFGALGLTKVPPAFAVTGYYYRGDGDVALNRLVGIPDDVVTLKGTGGMGSMVFVDDNLTHIIPGAHWAFGLKVSLDSFSADAELVALGGLDPMALLKGSDPLVDVSDIAVSMFTQPALIKGAVSGTFTPTFSAGPISWHKDFNFTARGLFTPPPLAPPPGIFFVNQIDF